MNIAESKTRTKYPLSPRKIIKKSIGVTFVLTVFAVIGMIGATFMSWGISSDPTTPAEIRAFLPLLQNATWIIAVLYILLVVTNYLYQRWYFAVYYYELEPGYLVIRKGPITPTEISVPYERFQDVYVDQDILDRIFRLYDVHISSATAMSGMEAHIDGLERDGAMALRDEILGIVKTKISKHTDETK